MIKWLALLIGFSPCFAYSDFKISYPEGYKERVTLKPRDSVLLINNSVQYLTEIGSGDATTIAGDGIDIPISDAFEMLTPDGWKVYSAPGIEFENVKTDLVDGEPWTNSLERTGRDNDLLFTVDWKHKEILISPFREKGVFDSASEPLGANASLVLGMKTLRLRQGDLRESLDFFAQMNGLTLEYDVFSSDRALRIHPSIAEFTHAIPSCITWKLPSDYESHSAEWLTELNRILTPYRLKTFLFANNVLFLTSIHEYGSDFCRGRNNEL